MLLEPSTYLDVSKSCVWSESNENSSNPFQYGFGQIDPNSGKEKSLLHRLQIERKQMIVKAKSLYSCFNKTFHIGSCANFDYKVGDIKILNRAYKMKTLWKYVHQYTSHGIHVIIGTKVSKVNKQAQMTSLKMICYPLYSIFFQEFFSELKVRFTTNTIFVIYYTR